MISRRRRTRGQALVEFALILPVFILILLGLFDLGRAVFLYNGLTNAAREGARLAIVNQDKGMVLQRIEDMTFGGAIANAGDLNDLVGFYRSNPDGTPGAECSTVTIGCIAVVKPTSQWSLLTPILSTLVGPITFEARSELPVESVCPTPDIAAYNDPANCPKQP